jgi:hypothetical protein
LICGEGNGAARVVEATTSPSRRLAIAWRISADAPLERPDEAATIQYLVIRLADGAIFAKQAVVWDPSETKSYNPNLSAVWSSDSRFVVATYGGRFATEAIDLYAMASDASPANPPGRAGVRAAPSETVTGPVRLIASIKPAVRALLPPVKDPEEYDFAVGDPEYSTDLKITNEGLITVRVMFWKPKLGPEFRYRVTLRVIKKKSSLEARLMSAKLVGKARWTND